MGDGWTVLPQKEEQEKSQGPALISARKPCLLAHQLAFTVRLANTWLEPGTGFVDPGAAARQCRPPPPSPPAAAFAFRRQPRETPVAMSDPGFCRPPWSVAEVLNTSRLPDSFVGALSARF